MLSFELSAIDIVLVVAVVVLLLLFLAQRQERPTTKSELPIKGQKKTLTKPEMPIKNAQEKLSAEKPSTDFQKCVHQFGYLKNLSKNTPVPSECFGCPKILRCLFPNESDSQVH